MDKNTPIKPRTIVHKGKYPRIDFICPYCNEKIYGRWERHTCGQMIDWGRNKKAGVQK